MGRKVQDLTMIWSAPTSILSAVRVIGLKVLELRLSRGLRVKKVKWEQVMTKEYFLAVVAFFIGPLEKDYFEDPTAKSNQGMILGEMPPEYKEDLFNWIFT